MQGISASCSQQTASTPNIVFFFSKLNEPSPLACGFLGRQLRALWSLVHSKDGVVQMLISLSPGSSSKFRDHFRFILHHMNPDVKLKSALSNPRKSILHRAFIVVVLFGGGCLNHYTESLNEKGEVST